MPTTELDGDVVQVAVGILRRGDHLLMQRRRPGTPCAGQWEFPGGKIEAGESPHRALQRELDEELGVEARTAQPLMQLPFDYDHARVLLEVFVVDSFCGEAMACEGQEMKWLKRADIAHLDVLAAVHPILHALDALSDDLTDEHAAQANSSGSHPNNAK